MALIPENNWPTQTTPASGNYPYGSARNVSSPGAGDGTPWILDAINDIWGMQQAILVEGGVTPSGVADTVNLSDYVTAINQMALDVTSLYTYNSAVIDQKDTDTLNAANAYTDSQILAPITSGTVTVGTGTTSTAYWTKYPDGTLIVQGVRPTRTITTPPYDDVITYGLPVGTTFVSAPSLTTSVHREPTGSNDTYLAPNFNSSATGFTVRITLGESSNSFVDPYSFQAIGRWA